MFRLKTNYVTKLRVYVGLSENILIRCNKRNLSIIDVDHNYNWGIPIIVAEVQPQWYLAFRKIDHGFLWG